MGMTSSCSPPAFNAMSVFTVVFMDPLSGTKNVIFFFIKCCRAKYLIVVSVACKVFRCNPVFVILMFVSVTSAADAAQETFKYRKQY